MFWLTIFYPITPPKQNKTKQKKNPTNKSKNQKPKTKNKQKHLMNKIYELQTKGLFDFMTIDALLVSFWLYDYQYTPCDFFFFFYICLHWWYPVHPVFLGSWWLVQCFLLVSASPSCSSAFFLFSKVLVFLQILSFNFTLWSAGTVKFT